MFRDKYTDFYFCDLHSSNFKVWITNKNDLQFNVAPSFSDTFTSPVFSQTRYHENTKIEKQDFKLKLAAINVTKQEWRAISEWLSPQKIGNLIFGWNEKHYYNVKVTSAPSGVMWIKNSVDSILNELYIVTFDVTFSTVDDWAALGPVATIPIKTVESDPLNKSWMFDSMYPNAAERYKNDYYIPFLMDVRYFYESSNGIYVYSNIGVVSIQSGLIYYPSDQMVVKVQYESSSKSIKLIYKKVVINKNNIVELQDLDLMTTTILKDTTRYTVNIGINCYLIVDDIDEEIQKVIRNLNNTFKTDYLLTNPSTFDSFVNITTNSMPFKFEMGNKLLTIDKTLDNINLNTSVFLNGKSGDFTYQGEVAQNARDGSGMLIFKDIQNDSLSLPSGRPETIKVIFDSYESFEMPYETTQSNNKTVSNVFYKAVFKCTKKLIYNRHKNFIMTFFNQIPNTSNYFNKDQYDTKDYYENTLNNLVVAVNPHYYYTEKDGELYLNVIFTDNCKYTLEDSYSTTSLNSFDKKYYVFISVCDLEIAKIESGEENFCLLDFQTRDVL